MTHRKRVLCVVGTRPEAVKMAPVIGALKACDWANVRVIASGQHRDMLEQVLGLFGISADADLKAMRENQTLPELTARMTLAFDDCFASEQPDVVLAQGDTTTVMVAALAAFYRKVPFGHIEAGLRTGDRHNPFPEEMNRVIAGRLARWHFAPTVAAERHLLAEGVSPDAVFVTGNTVIDALLDVAERADVDEGPATGGRRRILITAHRRENFGAPFERICRALLSLAEARNDVELVYPVHPNPNVKEVATRVLGGHPRISLCQPLDYLPFVQAMKASHIILTDSGGVQEEAPALGKPVLVLRNETERPEAVAEGVVKLVGDDYSTIIRETNRLLDDPAAYNAMARGVSPYGDGQASGRIVSFLEKAFFSADASAQ